MRYGLKDNLVNGQSSLFRNDNFHEWYIRAPFVEDVVYSSYVIDNFLGPLKIGLCILSLYINRYCYDIDKFSEKVFFFIALYV